MTKLTELELQREYLDLMENTSLDKLELALNEPNIFSILAIDNMEIRHSNFLAWLLNPKESHGLNDLFLKRFLREIFFNEKIKNVTPLDAETLDYRKVDIRREWQNIDLLIAFPDLVICIENKVRAKDDGKQLTTYKDIIEEEFPKEQFRQVFIYLTPYGKSSSHEIETYAFISYRSVISILDRILQIYNDLISTQAAFYIQDYIKSLKRNLMGTDTTNKLAREIYLNHKKLLDFIYENRPDHTEEFAKLLQNYLKTNGYSLGSTVKHYVRFLTPDLKAIVPKYDKVKSGWARREAFLFEFQIERNKLIFKAMSAPAGSNKNYKDRLAEIMVGVDGVNDVQGKSWQGFFREEVKMDIEEQMKQNPKAMPIEFSSFWDNTVHKIIQKIEKAMLDHKEELAALKQEIEQ